MKIILHLFDHMDKDPRQTIIGYPTLIAHMDKKPKKDC